MNFLEKFVVSTGFLLAATASIAGSYDDFFIAILRDNPRNITALLQRGFDPATPDIHGRPALLGAIEDESPKAALAIASWPGTKVEIRNSVDESPLMLAALKGYSELVDVLIRRGADVNKTGWTPLHYAATNAHLDIVQRLLDENAYIDAESPNGSTPLMMAALYGNGATVKLLLDAGADPTLKNQLGLNAVDFANRASRTEAAEFLKAGLDAWYAKRGKK